MTKIKLYQVDAFTDKLFSGNPAAICILHSWLDAKLMQSIANENNLPETAFVVKTDNHFEIRWFTPTVEVDLCGHATLAAAFVLFNHLNYPGSEIKFHSHRSGFLSVERKGEMLFLDFPTDKLDALSAEQQNDLEQCLGLKILESYKGKTDYIALIDSEKLVRHLQPDFGKIATLKARGLIVTARGEKADFVSRFFAPQSGIDEDPVTGSAHTSLIPIWSAKFAKTHLTAHQLSKRGGQLWCEYKTDRCLIGGKARLYLIGEINTD